MILQKPLFSTLELADLAAVLTIENIPIHTVVLLLNVSRQTLAQWRRGGEGPPFRLVKDGRVVYPRASFESFLRTARQNEIKIPEPKPSKRLRRILSNGGLHEGRELHC